MTSPRGTVLRTAHREAEVALDSPLYGHATVRVRDDLGVSAGDRVELDAHPAGPMGVAVLFAVVPLLTGAAGCAAARAIGSGGAFWIGLACAAAGALALRAVERRFRRYASLEGRVTARVAP